MNNAAIAEIETLLQSDAGRFSNYQKLSPFLLEQYPELRNLSYKQEQVTLDDARYNWLKEQYNQRDVRVLELGSSLGYFCFSLAMENNATVHAYEPIETYTKVCQQLAKLANLEEKFSIKNESICYNDLDSLPAVDLIIHLNVLHHAGCVYDQNLVQQPQDWESYAYDYLNKLTEKANYLFFQTGNVWKGKSLFPGSEAVSFVRQLLERGGWHVKSIGLIEDPSVLHYSTVSSDEVLTHPLITCQRNKQTNLVDYYREQALVASLPTGLAQRPLWFCKRK